MKSLASILGEHDDWRIVITDSGLGGLSICAGLEKRLRASSGFRTVRLVYVNAWPDESGGYNDMPDAAARAAVLDGALAAMTSFRPSFILIACNTLSVLYEMTGFSRRPAVPVAGIIDEGVELFGRALEDDPEATLALFGTRTTIESGEHVRRLVAKGIDGRRISTAACHGLAGAIDKDPDSPGLAGLVEACVSAGGLRARAAGTLFAGLCCTHYAFVADMFRRTLERLSGAGIEILDPGEGVVGSLASGLEGLRPEGRPAKAAVEVVSKVELPEAQRRAMARRLEPVSPGTARALLDYRRIPDLF